MKKILIVIMGILLTFSISGAKNFSERSLVLDKTFTIGGSDTLFLQSGSFSTDCDTMSFVFEIVSADSIGAASVTSTVTTFDSIPSVTFSITTDSIEAIGAVAPLSPSGYIIDTLTFADLTSSYLAFRKLNADGRVAYGSKVTMPLSSKAGKLWVKIINYYATIQDVRVKVWRIRKW